ncbi:hypothetical protein GW764_01375 [Candidatus Parcubacteria bacterium]|nr:hypothetical protein [Candidatus Parcubacteria bacterium]
METEHAKFIYLVQDLGDKKLTGKKENLSKYYKKVDDFFQLLFQVSTEFEWKRRFERQERKCDIDTETETFFTFIGSRRLEVVAIKDIKPDLTEVLRIRILVRDMAITVLFSLCCTYDFEHIAYVPRINSSLTSRYRFSFFKLYEYLKENTTKAQ